MNYNERAKEIRQLNQLTEDKIIEMASNHFLVFDNTYLLHRFFADHICDLILENNRIDKKTTGIFPYGPVGQYPYFVERVNKERISLATTWFYFMDEYCDNNGREIPSEHPLSFRGKMYGMFDKIDKELLPDFSKLIFPLHDNVNRLTEQIAGEKLCITYGGIGIHGHLAFNEPEAGVFDSDVREVRLNDFTVTINAIREGIGGNLHNFPRKALTLGMNQLFAADKMIFFCRNGYSSIDWANTVLRLALLGTPGDDYPVTYLKKHKDWLIVTDKNTLRTPISI
jgi:glucosamine-6-phosphate deaminase